MLKLLSLNGNCVGFHAREITHTGMHTHTHTHTTKSNQNANIVTSSRLAGNWCVVFGVYFIFWPIRKHVDKVIQVSQAVG